MFKRCFHARIYESIIYIKLMRKCTIINLFRCALQYVPMNIVIVSIIVNHYSVANLRGYAAHNATRRQNEMNFRRIRMSAALKSDRRAAARLKFLQEASSYNRTHWGRRILHPWRISIFNVMWHLRPTVASSGASTDWEYQESMGLVALSGVCKYIRTRWSCSWTSECIAAGDKYELMAVCPEVERSSTPNWYRAGESRHSCRFLMPDK